MIANITGDNRSNKTEIKATDEKLLSYRRSINKPLPTCFECVKLNSKHYLAACETFKADSPEIKRKTVIEAKRCINCLSLEHFTHVSVLMHLKCRKCGLNFQNKHDAAHHECYNEVKIAFAASKNAKTPTRGKNSTLNERSLTVHRINWNKNGITLMCTSAVKVVNPVSGK